MGPLNKFHVLGTETYLHEIKNLSKEYQEAAEKIPSKLAENPLLGKPLGYPFLREKRIKEKRIYYLIYEELKLVLLVAVSGKKDQQDTINHIQGNFEEFKKVAEEIIKQVS
ncbi:MAG: hypothetical protein AABX04_04475 [Nanoarchaeota archaeon]